MFDYKRPFYRAILILLVTALFTACAESEFPAESADECFEDEIFDEEAGVCYLACEDDNSCEEIDFLGFIGDLFTGIGDLAFYDGEAEPLILYEVDGNELGEAELFDAFSDEEIDIQENEQIHEEVWDTFTKLIPANNRTRITEFGVFTDGVDETMAYVEPVPDDPTNWRMVVDTADINNRREFIYTLIHEYGHVLTLNDEQVPFDEEAYFSEDDADFEAAASACRTFFTGEGCSLSNSYISDFYDQFWADIHGEHQEIDPEDTDALYDFYLAYEDEFLTDYAATNPGEDIAESWTHFILQQAPNGDTIAEQKILFFYNYPELVALRDQILPKVYALSR